jgi:hypothetical protein
MFRLATTEEILASGARRETLRKAAMRLAFMWTASALGFLVFAFSSAYFIVIAPLWQFLCWVACVVVAVVWLFIRGEKQ